MSPNIPLVLYDIPTAKGNECWSPNVWRVRMALNYKGLPYRTEWVEYPDISTVGKEIGAKPTTPNPDGSGTMLWTCPMLVDPNHLNAEGKATVLSDSPIIITYLDEVYPEKKVIPDGTASLHDEWLLFVRQNITMRIAKLVIPFCPGVLAPRGKEYFITTREKWWGPLDKFCPDRLQAWKDVQEGLDNVVQALDAKGEGNLRVIPSNLRRLRPTCAAFVDQAYLE